MPWPPLPGGFVLPTIVTRIGCAAFTLIEMAICLGAIGLMAGFSVQAMQGQHTTSCMEHTRSQLSRIHDQLQQFAVANNRYPLPARPGLNSSDGRYGTEVATGTDSGIDALDGGLVLKGALPHVTLGLRNQDASDCWNRKLSYAVTASLTTSAGYANAANAGQIELRRGSLSAPIVTSDKIAYVVLSHGADALGAAATEYSGAPPHCNAMLGNPAITRTDKENCDSINRRFFDNPWNAIAESPGFHDDLLVSAERLPMLQANCDAGEVTWGSGCRAPILVTLVGIGVSVTNIAPGKIGVALATCNDGVYQTLGVCLP